MWLCFIELLLCFIHFDIFQTTQKHIQCGIVEMLEMHCFDVNMSCLMFHPIDLYISLYRMVCLISCRSACFSPMWRFGFDVLISFLFFWLNIRKYYFYKLSNWAPIEIWIEKKEQLKSIGYSKIYSNHVWTVVWVGSWNMDMHQEISNYQLNILTICIWIDWFPYIRKREEQKKIV